MKTELYDKNGIEIQIGDKYITNGSNIFTVFWKGGAVCGGITFEQAVPLIWEIDDDYELVMNENLDWLEIITTYKV